MNSNLILVVFSFTCSLILNYLFNQWFLKTRKLDKINSRSSHTVIATKSGGIAIFTSLFLITLILYALEKELYDFSILLPLAIIFIIGVYDDFYDADFKLKFFIQIIVAKLFIDQGFVIDSFYGLFGLYQIPYIVAQLTTTFVFLVIVNAYNFIDGIDGLAISFAIFVLITFWFLHDSSELSTLNLICFGSLVPLYYFNFKKENKIFIGDAGSLFLGSLMALNVFSFLDQESELILMDNDRLFIAIIILCYPLLDLIRVFVIRILNKKSPFRPDKNHLHHILVHATKSHLASTFIIISINVILLIITLYLT
tara:strand:- start:859 stop:1791 length:933 start_codon:yes stop_codon:yes gene_type:complete